MKLDQRLLKFSRTSPNDLEGFMLFYPNKFPPIVPYYEEVAQKIGADPKAYEEYGNWAHEELFTGFDKIKKDYDNGDQNNLEFLVSIDQRFHKLFCYRFWVVNYLFADGPLHEFFVDTLKNSVRKFTEIGEDVEEYEARVAQIQRDLIQSEYADLYLRQALSGVELVKLLNTHSKIKSLFEEVVELIDEHSQDKTDQINAIWDKVVSIIKNKNDSQNSNLRKKLAIPLQQAEFRKTMLPVYNMLTHAVEFREENQKLAQRQEELKERIQELLKLAKQRLTAEEYQLFELSYFQAANFSKFKDVMGELDPFLLPVWFGIHGKVKKILNTPPRPTGHAAMFYFLVWYLPTELKAKVFSVDTAPFNLETL